ncbi:MAG: enoyl-CoA hydratase-related protein [Deltaproteobacteria bacterium]|nr:enoyl-CoA hydratase-related protein [Deltaproteobacteria bacterium]
MADVLLESDAGGIRTLTMNRPDRKNALSPELVDALTSSLAAADRDPAVRVVVLTGAGEGERQAFCAGGDLGGGLTGDGFFEQHMARGSFADLLLTMRRMKKPTVAAVNGLALGGGFGLVLSCDLAVAADDARLGTPEVKRGLFPMMIAALIDEVLPKKAAMELMLLGGEVRGDRCVELGIVNRVIGRAHVVAAARDLAERVAAMSPAVLALGKRAVTLQRDMPFEQKLSFLRDQLTLNLQLEDAAEGITAFLEKRDPVWKGR